MSSGFFDNNVQEEPEEKQSHLPDNENLARCWSAVLHITSNGYDDIGVVKQLHHEITWFMEHLKSRLDIVGGQQRQLENEINEFEQKNSAIKCSG